MKALDWDEDYAIGDPRVDGQHRRLFELYHSLGEARTADLPVVLHDLYQYAVFHFSEEEALMATSRYPDLEAHSLLHRGFLADLETLKGGTLDQAREYISGWLDRHILTEDRKIGEYLRGPRPR